MKPIKAKITINQGIITAIEPNTESVLIIDAKETNYGNAYILPGLVDSHCHTWGLGMKLTTPDISKCRSAKECCEIIKKEMPKRGEWIFARGWNQELWDDNSLPSKSILDEYFPNEPVYLMRVDGHSAWVNSVALNLAGINASTSDPAGGKILRNEKGEATGILVDNAFNLVQSIIPDYSDEQLEGMIISGCHESLRNGLTELHDMDTPPRQLDIYRKLARAGKLPVNVYSYASAQNDEYLNYYDAPFNEGRFHFVGIKFFMDGALGSRGAALFEPYADAPETQGLVLMDSETLYEKAVAGIKRGFQIAVHAIGDYANHLAINAFEKIRNSGYNDAILRLEHAQLLTPEDVSRIKKLNIIPSVQPIHCTSDAEMANARLGEARAIERGYLWQTLHNNNIQILGGSDFPIESHNPFLGIDAFVNRRSMKSGEVWNSKERITLENALQAYSYAPRKLIHPESVSELKIGSPADLIIIDNDLSDADKIGETKVMETIVSK